MKRPIQTALLSAFLALASLQISSAADDPLPSWNDGPAKQSIITFVKKVLPVNVQLAAYANVVKPDFGPDWQLRFQFTFLFPTDRKKKE